MYSVWMDFSTLLGQPIRIYMMHMAGTGSVDINTIWCYEYTQELVIQHRKEWKRYRIANFV